MAAMRRAAVRFFLIMSSWMGIRNG